MNMGAHSDMRQRSQILPGAVHVAIVDDSPVERAGFRRIIEKHYEVESLVEASGTQAALRQLGEGRCHLVVVGISRLSDDIFQNIKSFRRLKSAPAVLVFGPNSDDQFALRALRAGASGYLTKDSPLPEIQRALELVIGGGRYLPPQLTEALYVAVRHEDATLAPHERLSEREYQVMIGLASGKTVREISGDLDLSMKTVNTYKYRMYDKMNVRDPRQLVRYVTWNDLIKLKCA